MRLASRFDIEEELVARRDLGLGRVDARGREPDLRPRLHHAVVGGAGIDARARVAHAVRLGAKQLSPREHREAREPRDEDDGCDAAAANHGDTIDIEIRSIANGAGASPSSAQCERGLVVDPLQVLV